IDWLISNHPDNPEIFFLFGKNAYLKTRNVEGDRAFEYLVSIKSSQKLKLHILKRIYKFYAKMKYLARDVYLKLKT
ncbi:MAG: hypothetical protein J6V36_02815, partial [Clostridia bacterium]|nr:hypothetical protein [Clostridia bacterium]